VDGTSHYQLYLNGKNMINQNIKLIATLGPSTLKRKVLKTLKKDVDIFRLNMSHLNLKQLTQNLNFLKNNKIKNICLDTEGAQVRTRYLKKKKYFKKNLYLNISSLNLKLKNYIELYPKVDISKVKKKSKIKIGFNGLELQVEKNLKEYLKCKVINGGFLEANKGVHFDSNILLKPLTDKDIKAINIAKKFNVKIFALSFANFERDVKYFRSLLDKKDFIISKIETKSGFKNRKKIINSSNAILIDRGDLSRYIDISKIPLAQRIIIDDTKKKKKQVYIATNLLETMINFNEPTRAESNDVYSSLESGCTGLVLAAETAIGKYPINCVKFLKKCLKIFYNKKKLTMNEENFF